ncbi:TetR family transcriptional regulator [Cystobacter fuscus]|uniref:TetR family transcriptional regulator n=1 Tax=Cystobacter fuscus TaxID=43 RepID=UPI002B2B20DA|nr:TetR family transcriptional regulator [Cystobacter fuscus]
MSRWEPNAHERLQQAAMELFQERGYDRTTVEEIAARAGLTERTFFRYFTDKREVLFSGSKDLEKLIVESIAGAPQTMAPLDAVTIALETTAPMFEERRARSRTRQALIAAHAELRERELIKLSSLASAIAESLRGRGVARPAATLIAEAGIAIFKSAFERWVEDLQEHDLSHHVRGALEELRLVTAATGAASSARPQTKATQRSRRSSP